MYMKIIRAGFNETELQYEYDETIFHFVNEAIKRNINSVYDIEIISNESYEIKWNKFCDDLFSNLR